MKIALVSTKGGVAKTTSSIFLASALAQRGIPVRVLDADPQGSATAWADAAQDSGAPLPFEVLPSNVRTLKRLETAADESWSIIDTPPGTNDLIEAAIQASDMVIIPSHPAPLDIARAWQTLDVTAHKHRAILLTSTNPQTVLYRDAKQAFADEGIAVFDYSIRRAESIKHAFGTSPKKLHQYDLVLDQIMEVLNA